MEIWNTVKFLKHIFFHWSVTSVFTTPANLAYSPPILEKQPHLQHSLSLSKSAGTGSFSLTKIPSQCFSGHTQSCSFFPQLVHKSLKYPTLDRTNLFQFNSFEAACLRLSYLQHCFAFLTQYFQHPPKSLFGFNSTFSQTAVKNSRRKPNGTTAIKETDFLSLYYSSTCWQGYPGLHFSPYCSNWRLLKKNVTKFTWLPRMALSSRCLSVFCRNEVRVVETLSACLWLRAQNVMGSTTLQLQAEKEAERQYRGTPCSLNNCHSHQRDLPNHSWDKQTKHCEEAGAETVRAFIFYAGNCTCQ